MGFRIDNSGQFERVSDAESFGAAFGVSRETLDRLKIYAGLLETWQKTINLVAPSTLGEIWHRHFADSAQILGQATVSEPIWVDLGSGAGFPGLVLAILRAEFGAGTAILVESDGRKCAFLAEVVRKTGLAASFTVEIRNSRIENPATQASLGPANVVTARALAPLDRLLALSYPFFSSETRGVFLKGRDSAVEIELARRNWAFELELRQSVTDPSGQIVEIRGLRPA